MNRAAVSHQVKAFELTFLAKGSCPAGTEGLPEG
jgi:hypothetical protein